MAQEVVRRGVLVEPAHQVGDRAVEVLGPHHRRVEQQAARAGLHHPRLVIGHALEHLELHPALDAGLRAEQQAVGHVEEVVAGDAEVHRGRVLGAAAVLDHPLEVRVDLALDRVGRLGPAVQIGLDPLHREVGALDDAQLDRRAPALAPREGPGHERPLRAVRLRQIGLQHDAGRQGVELVLVEHLAERGDGEVEVAVLLHVEVHELGRHPPVRVAIVMPLRLAVEGAQPVLHHLHGVAERGEVDLARHRGDLHRDVLDVVAGQQREIRLEPPRRLGLAQDGLAELVQVETDARGAALGEVAAQVRVLAGQDQRLGLVPQAGHDRRDHEARQVLAHQGAQREPDALPPLHEARRAVALEQVVQLIRDALRPAAAEGLVGERDRELLATRVLHQAGEPLGPRALVVRLTGARLAQQRLRQLDRAASSLPTDAGAGDGACHRRSLPPLLPGERAVVM